MKRFVTTDVTSLLVHAMEHADELEDVVILWKKKGEEGEEGFWTTGNTTTERLNWFLDRLKFFILGEE